MTVYPQRWYIESGSAEIWKKEPLLHPSEIEQDSEHTLSRHASVPTTVQCLLFATCGDVIPIWAKPEQDEEVDVLHLPLLFPNGYQSYRISSFPILNSPMSHDWRIYVTQSPENAQVNVAVGQILGVIWRGNILLAKYGNTSENERDWLKNLHRGSAEFATVLLDA
ncbi:hypothetical protein CVT26_013839 [Gymnopilus dilepis]|uniref:Uncharacterized protein n=1 Tax=Gymnopilus dilepis TaxID=231916 RepID=A0A409Y5X9_9AGAR|nr:hypothetical protein CVT26_013839 [Gymnopilus dilepis]